MFWPAKLIEKIDENQSKVEMFDNDDTTKIVNNMKMKPFNKLAKIPPKRSKIWIEAYQWAVNEMEC